MLSGWRWLSLVSIPAWSISIYPILYQLSGQMGRVIINGPGDQGLIRRRVIPKTQKWCLIRPCLTLSIIGYVSRVKWRVPGNGVVPSPTPCCSKYWKGSLWVTLDYGRQLYFWKVWKSLRLKKINILKDNLKKLLIVYSMGDSLKSISKSIHF